MQELISNLDKYYLKFLAVNCTEAPEKPGAGTWEWSKSIAYGTEAHYTCGPYGNFIGGDGEMYETTISKCEWNKTWTPSVLDPCVAKSCPVIPFPPDETGMILLQDPDNVITLESASAKYSPRIPAAVLFPGAEMCTDGGVFMVVGTIPELSKKPLEIIFTGEGLNEAFHVVLNISFDYIERWGVFENVTQDRQGKPGDGTSVDKDEPFVVR